METYLPPIERPRGLLMKLVYALTRKRFGTVLTPLKVHSARLPLAFGSWYGKISTLDHTVSLPADLAILIRQQVARINVCEFCIGIGRWVALQKTGSEAKLDALELGRWHFAWPATAKRPPGAPAADSGKYMVRWVNENGRWLMAQDIWNSDVALPMAAASPNTKK